MRGLHKYIDMEFWESVLFGLIVMAISVYLFLGPGWRELIEKLKRELGG